MKSIIPSITTISTLFVSHAAFAHPGHDHSSPFAALIHLVWITPVIVAAALFTHHLRNKKAAVPEQNNDA